MKLCRFILRQVEGLINKYALWELLVGLREMVPVARSLTSVLDVKALCVAA